MAKDAPALDMPMSVLVVDDEPLARRRLEIALERIGDVRLAGSARDIVEAKRMIETSRPDLVLLDIKMPGGTGFDLLRQLSDDPPGVIFVTAFDAYALQAFDSHAVDYLLKPVAFDRLQRAIARARDRRNAMSAQERLSELAEVLTALRQEASGDNQEKRFDRDIWMKDRTGWVRIPVDRIDWIQAERDYVRIHVGGRSHLLRETITAMSDRLDPALFIRIHRSALVARSRVERIERSAMGRLTARLCAGVVVPIGRAYARETLAAFRSPEV